jgi:hypothetical protein
MRDSATATVTNTAAGASATTTPLVRFSEFLGIGYFGDERQKVIAPIFDSRRNAEKGWTRLTEGIEPAVFHVIFIEHPPSKYEFIAYPLAMDESRINYVLYRSFSSLSSVQKFRETYSNNNGGSGNIRTYIKFGWHDLTKPQKFDVMAAYVFVDGVDFMKIQDIKPGGLADRIRKNEL